MPAQEPTCRDSSVCCPASVSGPALGLSSRSRSSQHLTLALDESCRPTLSYTRGTGRASSSTRVPCLGLRASLVQTKTRCSEKDHIFSTTQELVGIARGHKYLLGQMVQQCAQWRHPASTSLPRWSLGPSLSCSSSIASGCKLKGQPGGPVAAVPRLSLRTFNAPW